MNKLETLKKQEWECVLNLINVQISVNEDILNEYRCCDFSKGERELIIKEQELLKSAIKKLSNIAKKELIVAYD